MSSLARFAERHPLRLVAILAFEAADLDRYLRDALESRAKALVRAGVIAVRGTGMVRWPAGSPANFPNPRRSPVSRNISTGLHPTGLRRSFFHHFLDAARALRKTPLLLRRRERIRQPSAAERFLYERLASLPATAGLFVAQRFARLSVRAGTRAMEVDLRARTLGLAVEVDGYYHFQDAGAYRRDRRKDVELQKRGYLVVRVLAEDVVVRLEDVLSIILEAVASCGGRNLLNSRGEAS